MLVRGLYIFKKPRELTLCKPSQSYHRLDKVSMKFTVLGVQHTYAILLCIEQLGVHDAAHPILPASHLDLCRERAAFRRGEEVNEGMGIAGCSCSFSEDSRRGVLQILSGLNKSPSPVRRQEKRQREKEKEPKNRENYERAPGNKRFRLLSTQGWWFQARALR